MHKDLKDGWLSRSVGGGLCLMCSLSYMTVWMHVRACKRAHTQKTCSEFCSFGACHFEIVTVQSPCSIQALLQTNEIWHPFLFVISHIFPLLLPPFHNTNTIKERKLEYLHPVLIDNTRRLLDWSTFALWMDNVTVVDGWVVLFLLYIGFSAPASKCYTQFGCKTRNRIIVIKL